MVTKPTQAAEIVDLVDSAFKSRPRLFQSEGVSAYESEVKSADEIASRLGWAVEGYRSATDGGWEGRLKSAGPSKSGIESETPRHRYHPLLDDRRKEPLPAHGTHRSYRHRKQRSDPRCLAENALCLLPVMPIVLPAGRKHPGKSGRSPKAGKRLLNRKNETESSEKEDEA